jgi:hypothetical protein
MKSKKINLYLSCIAVFLFFHFNKAQVISAHFFGENAWMPDTIGIANACVDPPCFFNGKLHKQWNNIKNSKAVIIRFGGIAGDKNLPTNFQYIKMIDSIRAKGMEPIMQVPFYKYRYTAQQAANIVQYINITKSRNVKYWIIGNEPDLSYSYTAASQIAAYFKPFASAMKAVDPSILTVGPECAWFNQTIMDGLTTPNGPDDITGMDGAGRYYLDVISFHTYPFNGSQTRAQVISKLTAANQLQDNLIYLNGRINNCNAVHNRLGTYALKSAITEANINWQNSANDNLNGMGANSFIGGQFVAEMMGIGMKNGLDFINVWSVIEGNNTALNIGYIDPITNNKKSMYYHFQLLAENFNGNYINGTANLPNIKAFGSQNAINTAVMIMNQDLTGNYNFTVRLNTNSITGNDPLKININGGISSEYKDSITNQTSVLLVFNPQGALVKKCIYSLATQAAYNLPPACMIITEVLPIGLSDFKASLLENNEVFVKWTTLSEINNNFFTVQKTDDGIIYEDIETVKGAGTSHQTVNYNTTDKEPFEGLSYYRLKQTDYDGHCTYSDLSAVTVYRQQLKLNIFPNPSDGAEINIEINSLTGADKNNREAQIIIYDSQGTPVFREIFKSAGQLTIRLPYKLIPGVYLLRAFTNLTAYTGKFIVK